MFKINNRPDGRFWGETNENIGPDGPGRSETSWFEAIFSVYIYIILIIILYNAAIKRYLIK